MDNIVSIPSFLVTRPDAGSHGTNSETRESQQSEITYFVPDLQSAPACPSFSGVRVFTDFLTSEEADSMLREIEKGTFTKAQSGKLKQHYGPKINFNKKKMNSSQFQGLPAYAWLIEDRFRKRADTDLQNHQTADQAEFERALQSFETTDLFVLRYSEQDSSNLDFHLDDTYAYGELILDLSLESDSVLTFLDGEKKSPSCVRIPLPARSLVAIFGKARFKWEHAILAYDIDGQRTSVTSRTLHQNLRGSPDGRRVLDLARGSR
jgi:alkylated DNA repair protein alkB family protein 4